jgi:PAS domain S-box-containing protein
LERQDDHSNRSSVWGDERIRRLFEHTASVTGEAYFHTLVRELARALGMRWAFVAAFEAAGRARILAHWDEIRGPVSLVTFDLRETPCEVVYDNGVFQVSHGVHRQFPKDRFLTEFQVESYLGVVMRTSEGSLLGHLAAFDGRPMEAPLHAESVMRVFAARAAAELERVRADRALHQARDRLASVIASATHAIVSVDPEMRIVLFNAAAERLFRLSAKEAEGHDALRLFAGERERLLADASRRPCRGRGLLPDGSTFALEVHSSVVEDGEGSRRTTLFVRGLDGADSLTVHGPCPPDEEIVGSSVAIGRALERIRLVAPSDVTVLITGETGTGKELAACKIHRLSSRGHRAFVAVNCASLPAGLVESELFGHEKGAFTGAIAARSGRFELADGGTIFLDEVGDMPFEVQAKLLRVLETREFERLGGTRTVRVDVRVVAATHRDLTSLVKAGRFREDLFYRLDVFPIRMPPLRDRREDIPLLTKHLVDRLASRLGRRAPSIDAAVTAHLSARAWPGNVRELSNVLERATIVTRGEMLKLLDESDESEDTRASEGGATPLDEALARAERNCISRALAASQGRIEGPGGAAERLSVHPNTLRSKMKRLGFPRSPKS